MIDRPIQNRVADLVEATWLLSDTRRALSLAVEAVAAACPAGSVLAFSQRADGSVGSRAAARDGTLITEAAIPRPVAPVRWIVDLARVPNWQQNRWIEPIRAGIHGPSYFQTTNTLPAALTGTPAPPDYGRMMVCHQGRMLAWIGVYVDGARGFRDAGRDRLSEVAAQIATPLRIAAMLEAGQGPSALTQGRIKFCRVSCSDLPTSKLQGNWASHRPRSRRW